MKVVTPEGYTFVTKFQENNSHKVLRSVDFFSIKFDEIFFDTVCWVVTKPLLGSPGKEYMVQFGVYLIKVALYNVIVVRCNLLRFGVNFDKILLKIHRLPRVLHHVCLQPQSYYIFLAFTAS